MGLIDTIRGWLGGGTAGEKAVPDAARYTETDVVNSPYSNPWRGKRDPTDEQLVKHFRGVGYTCAMVNATACGSVSIQLFAKTRKGDKAPRVRTAPINTSVRKHLATSPHGRRWLKSAENVDEVLEHPILDLLEMANDEMDGFALLELTYLYLDMVGKAYWHVQRDKLTGIPAALWPLPSHLVRVVRNKDGSLSHYEYGADKKRIKPEDVIVFRMPDIADPYFGGKATAKAMYDELELMSSDTALANALLENRAMPDAIFTPPPGGLIGGDMAKRFKQKLVQAFRLGRNGGITVVGSPLTKHDVAFNSRDMEALKRRQATKTAVYNGFGVPIALGEGESINRATLEASLIQHARLAQIPRLTRVCQRLNQQLVPMYGPSAERLYLWFENPVHEDEKVEAEVCKIELDTGKRTINETRAEYGEPPVAWGDEPWLPTTLSQPSTMEEERQVKHEQEAAAAEAAMEAARNPQPAAKPNPPPAKGLSDTSPTPAGPLVWDTLAAMRTGKIGTATAVKTLVKAGVDIDRALKWTTDIVLRSTTPPIDLGQKNGHGYRMPAGTEIKQACVDVFEQQRKWVLDWFRSTVKGFGWTIPVGQVVSKKDESDIPPAPAPSPGGPPPLAAPDLSVWDAQLAKEARPAIEVYFGKGAEQLAGRIDLDVDAIFNLELPTVQEAIDKAAMKFSASTNATTSLEMDAALKKLRVEMSEGIIAEGDALPELVKRVNVVFDSASKIRAERIALTESSRAMHEGQRIGAKNSGVVRGFEWLVSADPCPICIAIAERFKAGIGIDGTFGKQSDYGAGGVNPDYETITTPPAHPYCMCTMLEQIDEDALKDAHDAVGNPSIAGNTLPAGAGA